MISAIECNGAANPSPETRTGWEYHVEQVRPGVLLPALAKLGGEGWELCSALPVSVQASVLQPGAASPALVLILKRPLAT